MRRFGARRSRLARQLLTESALLGLLGGALGLAIAQVALPAREHSRDGSHPAYARSAIDPTIVIFALVLASPPGSSAGVLPVVRLPWTRLGVWLREAAARQ